MIEQLHKWIADHASGAGITYSLVKDDYGSTREGVVLIRGSGQPLEGAQGNQTLYSEQVTIVASSITGTNAKAQSRAIIALLKTLNNVTQPVWIYGGNTYAQTVFAFTEILSPDPQYIGQDDTGIKFYSTYFNISFSH